jgi:Fur family peroxide stress response transcriptional regulator
MIHRFSVDGKAERFDGLTGNHYHFICQECGEIYDLDLPEMTLVNETAQKVCNGQILRHTTNFFGVCNHCMEQKTVQ